MLTENEWHNINNILADIYPMEDLGAFEQKIMTLFRMLIPYTKGYLVLLDEKQRIMPKKSLFIDIDCKEQGMYIDRYYDLDYIKYVYEFAKSTMVYKDSEILDNSVRERTEFYMQFLKPINIPFGCGVLLVHDGRIIGLISMFRDENWGDFSDKEMYVLNVFKQHLENMVCRLYVASDCGAAFERQCRQISEEFDLTQREAEVMRLLCQGFSNDKISKVLVISLSTVKKHVYSIMLKANAPSRAQLTQLIYSHLV